MAFQISLLVFASDCCLNVSIPHSSKSSYLMPNKCCGFMGGSPCLASFGAEVWFYFFFLQRCPGRHRGHCIFHRSRISNWIQPSQTVNSSEYRFLEIFLNRYFNSTLDLLLVTLHLESDFLSRVLFPSGSNLSPNMQKVLISVFGPEQD